ncbi:DUF7507 domain-containing protein [Methanosarcina sp. Mfa9]|uniref:DUF7507 domain-containing protein n=1 Tax=Methanosarcina sp. Mfa9 TaxID=3439063 RepID=UPI003F872FF5
MPSAAGLGFTGDVPADFTGTGIFTITDPGGIDVGVPTAAPAGTISGNDMEELRLFYDPATDTLYVGMNTYVIAGDVDGDGDPGVTSAWLAGITGNDNPDFGGTESFALMLDIDEDGTYDAIAGVSGLADTSGFSVNQHANLFLTPPAGQFAAPLPANTGSLFVSPSAGAPDIEFTVLNISTLPVSSGSDPDPRSFSVNSFMGSFEDAGIGEDFLPGFPTSIKLASISDFVWEDLNGNGLQDDGEPGIPGVTVNLYDCADNFVATATTDATGYYGFTMGPGDYYVEFIAPEGYEFTTQDEGADDALDNDADPATGKTVCTTLGPGENDLTWDAGLYRQVSIGDFVWDDLDEDGIQDAGEPGIAGVTVNLYECEGTTPIATTVTDANGMYLFTGLAPGEYYVEFELPAGYAFSPQDQGADDALDSDADPATGETACTLLESGETDLTVDTGVYLLRSNIGDFVWNDLDMDGIQDENEPGIPGVTVNLYECDGTTPIASTSTDANGYYNFEVVPGDYHVEFILPAGYVFSPQDQGADDTLDSDADPVTGQAACTTLEPEENDPTWDAGMFEAAPAIDIEKATNGEDADEPTGPYIPVGNEVEWTYIVTNTGNVPLTNIVVTDDRLGEICTIPELMPGDNQTCTATGTAEAGQYANLGNATGYYEDMPVSDEDPSHYFGAAPAIDIEKSTNGIDADEPTGPYIPVDGTVTWEYVVTNTGNVQLTGIVATDSQGVTVSCPTDTLAPGESMTCTAEGTATAGQYENLGTATGYYEDMRVSDEDPSHYFGAEPAIDIEKHTNGFDADEAPGPAIMTGAPVTWEYIVNNTGNVELTNVEVYDDVLGYVGTIAVLPVGAMEILTMDGTAAPEQYENFGNATAVYDDILVEDTDPSHYFGAAPAIDIEKATNGEDADEPTGPYIPVGNEVEWTYLVTNTGNVPLANITVTDDRGVTVSCPTDTLAPGESMTCTATGTATEGQYANLGTATGYYGEAEVTDTDPSHYFGAEPAIDIEKSTNGEDADTPTGPVLTVGDTVTWEYAVTNTGNVPLTDIEVLDDKLGSVCIIPELMPGENETCTATGTAEAGQYANLGNATGYYEDMPVSDEDPSHYFGATPAIDIEKATNGEDADAAPGPMIVAGGTVEWTYVVTNTGNVPLENVNVVDDQGVTVSCPTDTLAPGESMTCTATGTAIPGQYENLGTTTGEYGQTTVSDADPSHYFGAEPAVDIEKHTNGNDADEPTGPFVMVGAPVTWEYIVNNTGNVELTNVEVSDDVLGYVGTIAVLPVGATETLTMDGTATPGQYENFGNATAVYEDIPVEDTDPSHYFGAAPAIDIEKSTNGEDADTPTGPVLAVGDTVTWEYVVTNTGNVPLTEIEVLDDKLGSICTIPELMPGDSQTCTATGTAEVGQYANIGNATGTYDGTTVSDEDPSHYYVEPMPAIEIEKSTNGEDADTPSGPVLAVGDTVTWEYVVTNTGNVPLTEIVVQDDQLGEICTIPELMPGDSQTCTATGTAEVGQYANIGNATGTYDDMTVSDEDPSHYYVEPMPAIDIEKSTNGEDADELTGPYIPVGEPVNWEYVVTNTGNVPLTNIAVTDDQGVTVTCPTDTLAPGESMTCTAEGTATAGQYENLGTATGNYDGMQVSDTDPSHYFGAAPEIDIEKATNGFDADEPTGPEVSVGDAVEWTYNVTNTGNVNLTAISISDDIQGAITNPVSKGNGDDILEPGEYWVFNATGVAVAGQYANNGTATGYYGEMPVTDIDPSHYFGIEGPGTGTPGYWKNHPEAWPVDEIEIGGVTYTKEEAIEYMQLPDGDKTNTMFRALVSTKLNIFVGNTHSCIDDVVAAADEWMEKYGPVSSGVKAKEDAWKVEEGEPLAEQGEYLYTMLDMYNNGELCAPHRE